jgi:Tol biopolymer transport system component
MLLVVLACSDSTGPTDGDPLSILAGSGKTDTVLAKLPQALIVEVRGGDSRPLSNAVVRFTAVPENPFLPSVLMAPLTENFYTSFVAASTDRRGIASVVVQLGAVAGPAKILIEVPELNLQDTARYTVLPGHATTLTISIRDTTVLRGAQYSISAAASDRFGNRRDGDPITYTSRSSVATVDASGRVTAAAEGRGTILVQTATATDSAQLSVVPQATLVVWGSGKLSTVNTDGSNVQILTTSGDGSLFPQWSADGTKVLIYEGDPGSNARLSTVDMAGNRTLVAGTNASLWAASYGRFTRDGSWIYFTGVSTSEYGYATHRVKPDGTQLEQVGPTPGEGGSLRPDVSPDGATEVFQTGAGVLASMEIATHRIKSLGVTGSFPRYSPNGSQIAYLAGQYAPTKLYVMNADGTGSRQLGNASYHELGGVDWSPDGQWLLATSDTGFLELVRVSDGLRLPLRIQGLQAAWKP